MTSDAGARTPTPRSAIYGLVLFTIYVFLYSTFVLANALFPDSMEWQLPGGVNLAVAGGLGLIVAALVLAVLFGWLCRREGGKRSAGP